MSDLPNDYDFDFDYAPVHEIHGRAVWRQVLRQMNFQRSPRILWEALASARRGPWAGQSTKTIAAHPLTAQKFCRAVRAILGVAVEDAVLLSALQTMPRLCAFCEDLSWQRCAACKGCSFCCSSAHHCPESCLPPLICGCPECRCK